MFGLYVGVGSVLCVVLVGFVYLLIDVFEFDVGVLCEYGIDVMISCYFVYVLCFMLGFLVVWLMVNGWCVGCVDVCFDIDGNLCVMFELLCVVGFIVFDMFCDVIVCYDYWCVYL